MTDYFAMGGYAAYVWPSYGLTAVVMIGLLVMSLRELKDNEATLKALENLRPGRRARRERATAADVTQAQAAPRETHSAGEPAAQDG